MKQYDDDLIKYYQKELSYLRNRGQEFADKYPKVAGNLDIGIDNSSDPHIERLIESFAFLTGRIQKNIDNEFPELSTSLLSNIYPQLLNAIPSMTIAHFSAEELEFPSIPFRIEKHHRLAAFTSEGEKCKFRTSYPIEMWPISISFAGIRDSDSFPILKKKVNSPVLQIRIKPLGKTKLNELNINNLRFHLHGESSTTNLLYEYLFSNVQDIKIYSHDEKTNISSATIKPVGFNKQDEVLPYPKKTNYGYRLLQEYFMLPEKFLFFDIENIDIKDSQDYFDILFVFKKSFRKEFQISKNNFLLGCTPIINLFQKLSEPIRIDNFESEYKINPDSHREHLTEIYSIESISPTVKQGNLPDTIDPYFTFKNQNKKKEDSVFWHTRKEETTRSDFSGSDVLLSLMDIDFKPTLPEKRTLYARIICTNRNIAGGMSTGMSIESEDKLNNLNIKILKRPTPRIPSPEGKELWRLISILSLNYLSLSSEHSALEALREIIALFDFENKASTNRQVSGISSMTTKRIARRFGKDNWRGFCRGIEIVLELNLNTFTKNDGFLLASVLNYFFPLYTSINSFTQLKIKNTFDINEIWKTWAPRTGNRTIL